MEMAIYQSEGSSIHVKNSFQTRSIYLSYKDYITTFTKTAISKTSAKYSDNTGKNFKAIVYPSMLENVRNSLKIETNKFAKL